MLYMCMWFALMCCFSVVMLDEAHERNINTDIVIGLLKKVLLYMQTQWDTLSVDLIR